MTDPQHRLFLECAWHALEDAGCEPAGFDGSIGVYGTSSASGYLVHNLLSHHDPNAIMGQGANFELISLSLQNDKDFLTTRVSHQFDLRGPSIAVQTACSSSLVAVHLACQSLLSGECDMALAGGVSIRIPQQVGYWHEPGSMVSAVGHCRPFDVRSDGTVFGSGVAIVVLKPLQAAIDDGDRIHAVIRGSALNNDGSMKMGYAAPSAAAQADVIAEAHAVAGVDSSTISYRRNTRYGNAARRPIEIEGLAKGVRRFRHHPPGPCMLGSVKSNIGHLEVASGIAGLIKTILCLKHRAIPATLHFTSPNPELHLDRGPFTVQSDYGPWECGRSAPGRRQLIRRGRYQRARRRRRGTGTSRARRAARAPGAAVVGANRRGAARLTICPGDRAVRSRAAGHVRRRVHPWPPPQARTFDWAPSSMISSTLLGAAGSRARQRIYRRRRGGRRIDHRIGHGPSRFPVPRPGRSTCRRWRAGCTSRSRCSPSISTGAPTGSVPNLASTCARRCSTVRPRTWRAPTAPSPPCSQWNTRLRSWPTRTVCAPAAYAGHSIGEYRGRHSRRCV